MHLRKIPVNLHTNANKSIAEGLERTKYLECTTRPIPTL